MIKRMGIPIIVVLMIGFLVLPISCNAPEKLSLKAARDQWRIIGPEYTAYVEADDNLDDRSKQTRLLAAELMTKNLEEVVDE